MSEIIDRRANGRRKSAGNQQRFLKRYKAQIREAVARSVTQRKIADTDRGGNITIPARDLNEPNFSLGSGGARERVLQDLHSQREERRSSQVEGFRDEGI